MKITEIDLVESNKTAVVVFGRFNPPTVGHMHLINQMKSYNGDRYVFMSHSQDNKKNPLTWRQKFDLLDPLLVDVSIGDQKIKNPVEMLQHLSQENYVNVIYIVGDDRVASMQELIDQYNGQADRSGLIPFSIDTISVVSAGQRDPDSDGVEGISATKMRFAARSGDFESFLKGTPQGIDARKMYHMVRQGMGVDK